MWTGGKKKKAIQANCPYLKKDIYHLGRIQRAATRWVKGLRDLSYEERSMGLGVHLLGSRQHTLAFYGSIIIVDMSNNSASSMPRRIELGQVYGIRHRNL